MIDLILASGSEVRIEMLTRAGLRFEAVQAHVDEQAIRAALEIDGVSPRDCADALAEAKALKVSSRHSASLVIGADQVLDFEGEIISKSRSPEELRHQLGRMRGRRHKLYSAVVVAEDGQTVWRSVQGAALDVRSFSDRWLDDYVSRNWDFVRGSVGGYLIEGEGVRLFDRVDGDTFTILGLPLVPLLSWLALRGSIPG